jgi:hypothetical protein
VVDHMKIVALPAKRKSRGHNFVRATGVLSFLIPLCALMAAFDQFGALAQTVPLAHGHPAIAGTFTDRAASDQPLTITVALTLRHRARLAKLLAAQQDPQSPQFHKWLTPVQFAKRFGRTKAEIGQVSHWLAASGFQITSSSPREITAQGSAAIAESAFNITIAASPTSTVFANVTDPEIPAGLANLIGAIEGLDNAGKAIPLLHMTPAAAFPVTYGPPELPSALMLDGLTASGTPGYAGGSGDAFGPADFWTFYDEKPLLNAGTNGSGF